MNPPDFANAFFGPGVMERETCMALSAVFPLLLVTVAGQHRRAIRKIRRRQRVFNAITEYSMMFAVIGLVLTVIGVQVDGLASAPNAIVWIAFSISVLGLLFMLIGIVGDDQDEHAAKLLREKEKDERARESRQLLELEEQRRSRVWWRRLARGSRSRGVL